MKILHTADWHIGQRFFDYDRTEEHEYFLRWLKKILKDYAVDVLLIAGDIFDNPNPSAESQRIYYKFLREITAENTNLQIVIIAGNHDSAARLEAPTPLLNEMNIYVKGLIPKIKGEIDYKSLFIPLKEQEEVKAWCIAVPYLRQGDYPSSENYIQGVKEMYNTLYNKITEITTLPVIFMGHLQATGAEISKNDRSERVIIGGLEGISAEIFEHSQVIYTALGHLHKQQKVNGKENIRYAGSPLPMSFAEKNYKQGVNLIILENTSVQIERINFDSPVELLSLPKEPQKLSKVLQEIETLPEGEITFESPYLELKILLTEPEPSMRNQIEEALKNKAVRLTRCISYRNNKETKETVITQELKNVNPLEIAGDIFYNRYGTEMPEKIKSLLIHVIQEAENENTNN